MVVVFLDLKGRNTIARGEAPGTKWKIRIERKREYRGVGSTVEIVRGDLIRCRKYGCCFLSPERT